MRVPPPARRGNPEVFAPRLRRSLVFFLLALPFALTSRAADVSFRISETKAAALADAVVSLIALDPPPPNSATAPAAPEISQQGQEFLPYVTAVQVGTTVRFPNRDTVQHHVYSLSPAKKFELPLHVPGKSDGILFDRAGVVTIGCNIHDWMLTYVVVLATPHFAVTAADGAATVPAVPPGRYRAEVWHPRLAKMVTREITVTAAPADPLAFSLTLKPDQRIRRAPDARGSGYK